MLPSSLRSGGSDAVLLLLGICQLEVFLLACWSYLPLVSEWWDIEHCSVLNWTDPLICLWSRTVKDLSSSSSYQQMNAALHAI